MTQQEAFCAVSISLHERPCTKELMLEQVPGSKQGNSLSRNPCACAWGHGWDQLHRKSSVVPFVPEAAQQGSDERLRAEAGLEAGQAGRGLGLGEVAARVDDEPRAALAHGDRVDPEAEPAALHREPAAGTPAVSFPQCHLCSA